MMNNKVFCGYKVPIVQTMVHSHREGGRYGDWEEEYDIVLSKDEIQKITAENATGDQSPDVSSILDLKPKTDAWIVWVIWSTGDSFGYALYSDYEVLAVFADPYCPEMFKKYVEDYQGCKMDRNCNRIGNEHLYHADDGQIIELPKSPPWKGYFEHLNSVNVNRVTVQ